jgi:hypothetical protein
MFQPVFDGLHITMNFFGIVRTGFYADATADAHGLNNLGMLVFEFNRLDGTVANTFITIPTFFL